MNLDPFIAIIVCLVIPFQIATVVLTAIQLHLLAKRKKPKVIESRPFARHLLNIDVETQMHGCDKTLAEIETMTEAADKLVDSLERANELSEQMAANAMKAAE